MKLFAIVIPCNTHWTPFFSRYQQLISGNGCKYDVILWNRENIDESFSFRQGLSEVYEFRKTDICNDGNIKKVPDFFRFAKFVRGRISSIQYDGIFFLTTAACTVALNAGFLSRKYRSKYWIDIRDCSYEWFLPYYSLLKKAIKHSYAVSISSSAYTAFLPKHEYVVTHNIDTNLDNYRKLKKNSIEEIIRISYIGNIAYFEENYKLLQGLKNDERFRLQYYGANSERIEQYCKQEGIYNTDFFGRFNYEQTGEFYQKTDIINNVYGNGSIGLRTALSNKIYYAAALKKPIITSPDTYVSDTAKSYGFGFSIDFSDQGWSDKLFDWYQEYMSNPDLCRSDDFWEKSLSENEAADHKLIEFLNSGDTEKEYKKA